jgi:axin 1
MRSASSIDRVNDWLSSSTSHPTKTTTTTTNQPSIDEIKAMNKKLQQQQTVNAKTTVAYFLPGEDLPYISTFNGNSLTLAQFKQLITKKGKFRYFFKTKSDLLDEECVVFEEVTDENDFVPKFNEKIIAKIEKVG